jgi:membrane-associated protease RseP (regulator of RpoE activity)
VHYREGFPASADSGWIRFAKRGNGSLVDPAPEAEETLLPPPPPGPGTLGELRPPLLNVFLFLLTFASAFLAGTLLNDTQLPDPTSAERMRHGLGFALALVLIMLTHEMGHFFLARRHGVDATWPFFIPAPLLSLIGTLGAVIRLRSLPRTRRALIDIGAAGPIAGFVATIPVLVLGLRWSTVVPIEPATPRWTLFEALMQWFQSGTWPPLRDAFDLGYPVGMAIVQQLAVGPLPQGQTLALHPIAVAGWFGLLLTALNLLPLGQLDGGHVLFGASPKLHRVLGPPISAALLALGVFTPFPGWILWGLLMGLGLGMHPRLAQPEERIDGWRRLWVVVSLLLFALSFSPVPLALLAR